MNSALSTRLAVVALAVFALAGCDRQGSDNTGASGSNATGSATGSTPNNTATVRDTPAPAIVAPASAASQ